MKTGTQTKSECWKAVCVSVLLLAPSLAYAHAVAEETSGVWSGLMHPPTGFDHMAAMMAVGLWASQCGGRTLWFMPLSFVAAMLVGGAMGVMGIAMPFVEPGIAVSVLVLGLLVATGARLPLVLGSILVGLFAIFHGHAHGAEMPETVQRLVYGAGFVLATGLMHGCGIGLGWLAQRMPFANLVRYIGGGQRHLGHIWFLPRKLLAYLILSSRCQVGIRSR